MKIEQIREIADAILYEGYLLYPYRHSSIKNRQRWMFGIVSPQAATGVGRDAWRMQTQCLLVGDTATRLDVRVRFLHILERAPRTPEPAYHQSAAQARETIEPRHPASFEIWEEGIPREVSALDVALDDLLNMERHIEINIPGGELEDAQDPLAVRHQQALMGMVTLTAEPVGERVYRLTVRIENTARGDMQQNAILQALVSTHTLLQVYQGAFVSQLEPPDELSTLVQQCQNLSTWPVLIGDEGETDAMLSSPIILYDYPRIAPESVGTLFDGTEIDEILTLRILTLTDEEKREMREADARTRDLLERTEALSAEQLLKLHGVIRSLKPIDEAQEGIEPTEPAAPTEVAVTNGTVRARDRVRLHPNARADAFDILLNGKTARVEEIKQDFEERCYLVVTLDDDPGREQEDERVLPGHRFFFYPQEIERLEEVR
jgi:hypothetical protein